MEAIATRNKRLKTQLSIIKGAKAVHNSVQEHRVVPHQSHMCVSICYSFLTGKLVQ